MDDEKKLKDIIKRKFIEMLGRHAFTAGWSEINRRRFAETFSAAVIEELPTQAAHAALVEAAKELLKVCHCTNDCSPEDMTCATNKMLATLYGIENVKNQRAALLDGKG